MLRRRATKDTTRNQVQIFSLIKCIEACEVTLSTQLGHLFIMVWLKFHIPFLTQRTSTELTSCQHPEEDLHVVPKYRKIPVKTDENTT